MEQWISELIVSAPMLLLFGIIAISLFVLSKGADILVDEAVSLSLRWGIPKVVIGATIVSLGTTLPEATVSIAAAVAGNPDIALGNAIGSIICNTSLIIGIAALIRPLPVQREATNRQSIILLSVAVLLILMIIPWTNVQTFGKQTGNIHQWVGFLFVLLLGLYLFRTFKRAREGQLALPEDSLEHADQAPAPVILLKLAFGLFLIVLSSKVLLPTVQTTAQRLGIPDSIIAATLIAFGTSLPELITAIQSSRKGHGELAIGNIIGANILNILFVVGAATSLSPRGLSVPSYFYWFQLPVMLLVLLIFTLCMYLGKAVIGRVTGFILLLFYSIFTVFSYTMIY